MKQIKLSQEKFALIDEQDYDLVSQYNWYYNEVKKGVGYARRSVPDRKYLHRFIAEIKYGQTISRSTIIDHKNRNTLDCRRDNIRTASNSENNLNKIVKSRSSTPYKGIWYDKRFKSKFFRKSKFK